MVEIRYITAIHNLTNAEDAGVNIDFSVFPQLCWSHMVML